ncbi:MAG: hypothetical protein N2440_06475 [Actinobacteria bacterium]|nr:hypothetical protein [Actinomycetota bacterium]
MKRLLAITSIVFSFLLNSISFAGSFYFPFISPKYEFNPVAMEMKRLWYFFLPGDFLLFLSLILLLAAPFFIRKNQKILSKLLFSSGILSIIKGALNTYFYWMIFNGITPSFMNIITGIAIIVSSKALFRSHP